MAIITQTVHLTTKTNNIPQIVRAVQNDSGRDIKMILDDLTVTSGMTGELTFKRSDGTFYGVTATPNTSDSSFTAQMDQALTQPGKTYAQLKVTNTDVVSTFSFVIYVEADQSGTVTPQEGIDLVSAVQAAEDAADRAESAASTFETDTTLSVSGMAADAKATGDAISAIESDLVEIDATLTQSGKAADSAAVGNALANISADAQATVEEIADLKNTISESTRNLFDFHKLAATGISIENGSVTGPASAFNTAFNQGIPLGVNFEANTQYTWSLKGVNGGDVTSGNGLSFRFKYTDNTIDANPIPNNTPTPTQFSFTSASGKTVSALLISYSSAGGNAWTLSNIQLEKGATASEFIPYITAADYVARKEIDEINNTAIPEITAKAKTLDGIVYLKTYDKNIWERGTVDPSTGALIGSNNYCRTIGYKPDEIQKIVVPDGYEISIYAYDEANTFIGYLDADNDFSKTGVLKRINSIDFVNLPDFYNYIIIGAKTSHTEITVDDFLIHVEQYKYRFIEKQKDDLFLLRKTAPSYYFDIPDTVDDYYDTEYINQKINSVPAGKHFIFITDPHWKINNTKNSTVLLKYVKEKLGIKDVFEGGDILNQETTKFAAHAQMSLYMNELKDAFGDSFLTVQGNHDKNVANLAQILSDNPDLSENDVALPYNVIYDTMMSHFAHRVFFDDWTDWLTQTGATGGSYNQLEAYRKMHYHMDDDDQKIRYIVICATNTNNNGVVKQYFGAVSLNEACLQYEWFRDTLKSTPDGYDIVVISHVIVNDKKDGTGTWLPYDQIAYYLRMMAAMATKTNVTVRNLVSTASPEGALLDTFFASGSHTMQFNDVITNHNVMFMLGGDCHCDVLCSTNINMQNAFVENGGSVSLSTGEVPAITTLCDARAVPSIDQNGNRATMTAGTITEQCFEVVTITQDKQIVLTRFGAGVDRSIQIT